MMESFSVTTNRMHPLRLLQLSLCWALLGIALHGCGSGEPKGRVFGKVSFGGQAVSEGLVIFSNGEKGIHMTGTLKSDGSYEILTTKGAGLPVGTYRVCVCPPPEEIPPISLDGPAKIMPPKSYANIPKKYRDAGTSGLSLTIQQGENPFDIAMQP